MTANGFSIPVFSGFLCGSTCRRVLGLLLLPVLATPGLAWAQSSGIRWVAPADQTPPDAWGLYQWETRKWVSQRAREWGSATVPAGEYSVYVRWKPDDPLLLYAQVEVYEGRFTPLHSSQELALFAGVAQMVESSYVDPPDMGSAIGGALLGMIESLDSYSSYVDASTYRRLNHSQEASPGLIVSKRYGYLYVVSVVPGSSADREGLYEGALIESINGQTTAFMSLWEAQKRIYGSPGTDLHVRAVLARGTHPFEFTLTRQRLEPRGLSVRRLENGSTLLLTIPHFSRGMAGEVESALRGLEGSGIDSLILDLRGAAEGSFEEAAACADWFVPAGQTIMTEAGRNDQHKTVLAEQRPLLTDFPTVVLIDRGTSGPAEVFAAALQDHGVAETIGSRSNGQGGLQQSHELEDGSLLVLTETRILRPNQQPIQSTVARQSGILPELLWPDPGFESQYFSEHAPQEGDVDREFYRGLRRAVHEEQIRKALDRLQELQGGRKKAA